MIRIIKAFSTLSLIFFLIALLAVYAFMPDQVGITFSENGRIVNEISRNSFFYLFAGSFILLQLIFYLFKNLVLSKRSGIWEKRNINGWFRGMFLAVNIFFIMMILFLGFANNAVDFKYESILLLAYAGPVVLVVWLLLFPVFYFLPSGG